MDNKGMANKVETVETSQGLNEEPTVPASLQQLIDSQDVKPVRDISVFAGLIPDDEINSFVSEIYEARKRQ